MTMPLDTTTMQLLGTRKCLVSSKVWRALKKVCGNNLKGAFSWLGSDHSISAKHLAVASKRLRMLARVAKKVRLGEGVPAAVKAEKIGLASFYRLLWNWDTEGVTGLIPKYSKCGRPCKSIRGNALACWQIAEDEVLAASVMKVFCVRRAIALSKIQGSLDMKRSAVKAMLRDMDIDKESLVWGIVTMTMGKDIYNPACLLRAKGCPLALRMNLRSQAGEYTWKFMRRIAERINKSSLF